MNVVVTAGPTREAIDPVRFLSNRSSGRMGFALARAAAQSGHKVRLVSGPVALAAPGQVERIDVESAQNMFDAVAASVPWAHVMVLAAAVADYRPVSFSPLKLEKQRTPFQLPLEPTPDILGSLRHPLGFTGFLVGFAAETHDLEARARRKLAAKGCDLIAANEVGTSGTGFESEENALLLLFRSGRRLPLARAPKPALAAQLWNVIENEIAGAVLPPRL